MFMSRFFALSTVIAAASATWTNPISEYTSESDGPPIQGLIQMGDQPRRLLEGTEEDSPVTDSPVEDLSLEDQGGPPRRPGRPPQRPGGPPQRPGGPPQRPGGGRPMPPRPGFGRPGAPGQPGMQGRPGEDGKPGEAGRPGPPGKPAAPGRPGQPGLPGPPGPPGRPGQSPPPPKKETRSLIQMEDQPQRALLVSRSSPEGSEEDVPVEDLLVANLSLEAYDSFQGPKGPGRRPGQRPGGQRPKGPNQRPGRPLPPRPGRPGAPGEPGMQGRPGEAGKPGNPGRPGPPGKPAPPARPGPPGVPGPPGAPGRPGQSPPPLPPKPVPQTRLLHEVQIGQNGPEEDVGKVGDSRADQAVAMLQHADEILQTDKLYEEL